MKIVLASTNEHKYSEFADFFKSLDGLAGCDIRLVPPWDPSVGAGPGEVAEDGRSYEENALIKARTWAHSTGIPALADDSGLEVRHLGWGPGIHSARTAAGGDPD
ncbi:MAG: non-canonical purine NTP pyrophosphatase, RdgB/HAM1 family, partial [Synergistaceae bacterium]|nr:non-canonical purine NTP pyrophosphatase, RdgB/HAM1 family [Synergistaceae bacterium]